jgi:ATP-dependent Lon protease
MEDKLIISFKHVLPEIFEKMGVGTNTIEFTNDNITYIVENYTAEPGIRKLKEILFEIVGEINIHFLQNSGDENKIIELPLKITNDDIKNIYLKERQEYLPTMIPKVNKIGVMNGLWANAMGRGGIIPIEVVMHPSSTFLDLKLTGMQGDVMKESMAVAKSLAWSLLDESLMKEKVAYFNDTKMQGIHVHCPEGATPKDGPSAGTAITVAIHSVLTKQYIKNTLAMTGEINLQGNVTAIGGLDLKVLGGIRAGVREFIFPEDNKKDYNDLMEKYKDSDIFDNIKFHSCNHISQVLKLVYEE